MISFIGLLYGNTEWLAAGAAVEFLAIASSTYLKKLRRVYLPRILPLMSWAKSSAFALPIFVCKPPWNFYFHTRSASLFEILSSLVLQL
jgi:hypothetical protein